MTLYQRWLYWTARLLTWRVFRRMNWRRTW